jgi:hypothetical protein
MFIGGGHRDRMVAALTTTYAFSAYRMVAALTTTYAFSAYHHQCCEFESHLGAVYMI